MLSLAKQMGVRAVKTFGNTIANGLKGTHCPSIFCKAAINLAQTNHRVTTRMQRYLHGFPSEAPIQPLDQEKAIQAAGLLLAEISTFTVAGAAVFKVQSIISEPRREVERLIKDIQALKTEWGIWSKLDAEMLDHIGKQARLLAQKQVELKEKAEQLNLLIIENNLQLTWLIFESKRKIELAQKQEQLVAELAQKQEQLVAELAQKQELLVAELAQRREQLAAELVQNYEKLITELFQKHEQLAAELVQKQEQLAAELAVKFVDEFKELREFTTYCMILNVLSSWKR